MHSCRDGRLLVVLRKQSCCAQSHGDVPIIPMPLAGLLGVRERLAGIPSQETLVFDNVRHEYALHHSLLCLSSAISYGFMTILT